MVQVELVRLLLTHDGGVLVVAETSDLDKTNLDWGQIPISYLALAVNKYLHNVHQMEIGRQRRGTKHAPTGPGVLIDSAE
jgi:hypothetical protein